MRKMSAKTDERLCAILIGAISVALPVFVYAQETTFAQPGDTGSIEYPVGNLLESDGPLEGARMEVDKPAFFTVTGVSVLGPDTIPPAVVKTFVVEYEIGEGAPEGPFTVTLRPRAETENVEPVMSALDTSVSFDIADPLFLVGGRKLTLSGSAGKTRENSRVLSFQHRVQNPGSEGRNA